jgi:hypothetical protein
MSGFLLGGVDAGTTTQNIFLGGTAPVYTSTTATTKTGLITVKALIRNASAGTFTPQIKLSATNTTAFSVLTTSWIKVTPVGNATVTNVGAWA